MVEGLTGYSLRETTDAISNRLSNYSYVNFSVSYCFLYREVFFVDEPVLMVPKLYVNLPTCLLRVVDNDSGEELTRVFQKVAPNNLKKNKVEERNYTEHFLSKYYY